MLARRNLLDVFPVEMWTIIRSCLSWDLPTQVSFYLFCEPIREFVYGDQAKLAPFWEKLCVRNGIGISDYEGPKHVDWEDIVWKCWEHSMSCEHPGCGAKRLQMNGTQIVYSFTNPRTSHGINTF